MASSPKKAPVSNFEPDAYYRFRLVKSARLGDGFLMRPQHDSIQLRGDLCSQIADAIDPDSIEKVGG